MGERFCKPHIREGLRNPNMERIYCALLAVGSHPGHLARTVSSQLCLPRTRVWLESILVHSCYPISCFSKASGPVSYWTGENDLTLPCPRIWGSACNRQVASCQRVRTAGNLVRSQPHSPMSPSYPLVKPRARPQAHEVELSASTHAHGPLSLQSPL